MSTYLTNFKGEFQIPGARTNVIEFNSFANNLDIIFGSEAKIDYSDDTVYIDGKIDDTQEYVEQLMVTLASILYQGHDEITIEAQGEDPKDRWDIIIRDKIVYIRRHQLVPLPEEPYIKS